MKDAKTLAHINLFGLLASLSTLCEVDDESKALIQGKTLSVTFRIRKGPCLTLVFKDGQCQALPMVGNGQVQLFFRSYQHFNALMDGQANPIPLWGFTRLGFLTGPFDQLSKRLEYFLRPTDELLAQADYRHINTALLISVALSASIQVANLDPELSQIRKGLPRGDILFSVTGGPAQGIGIAPNQVQALPQLPQQPRATMTFADMDAACDLLNGRRDSFSSIAAGRLQLAGYIPLLDNFDKFLFKVNQYLN